MITKFLIENKEMFSISKGHNIIKFRLGFASIIKSNYEEYHYLKDEINKILNTNLYDFLGCDIDIDNSKVRVIVGGANDSMYIKLSKDELEYFLLMSDY